MLPRYRRRMSMSTRPINRIKHVVDFNGSLTGGTQLNTPLVVATDTPTLADTDGVQTGSKVNGIYLHVEIASNETDAGAIPNVYMIIWKNAGANLSAPSASSVGPNDNKRYVIHQEMVMINNLTGGTPRTMFNGVIVIPKGFRRFGPNDELLISVLSTAVNIHLCWQAHYREFR